MGVWDENVITTREVVYAAPSGEGMWVVWEGGMFLLQQRFLVMMTYDVETW